MTRSLITLLLVAHVALAAWAFGPFQRSVWEIPGQSPRDPERVALQVRPESIVLLRPAAPASADQAASTASAATGETTAVPVPAAAAGSTASAPVAASAPRPAVQRQQDQGTQQQAKQPGES